MPDSYYTSTIERGTTKVGFAVWLNLPTGAVKLCNLSNETNLSQTGLGVFDAAGDLLSISSTTVSQDLGYSDMTIQLSGLTTEFVEEARDYEFQGREVRVWHFIDSNLNGAYELYETFRGNVEDMIFLQSGDGITIQVKATNFLVRLGDSNVRRYTVEDQKRFFASHVDKGLRFVESIAEQELVWGE